MATSKGLATPQIQVNNELISIKPNSFKYVGGIGEINIRAQSAGGRSTENVVTNDTESKVSKVMFTLISTASNVNLYEEWKRLTDDLTGVAISATDPDAVNFTRSFRNMFNKTDSEIAFSQDGEFEVEFHGEPVA